MDHGRIHIVTIFVFQLATRDQEVQLLTTQRDEISAHLQQYVAAYQQVSIEKEEIQRQYLLQAQLMDRLQHDEVQGKVSVEMHLKELQNSRVSVHSWEMPTTFPPYLVRYISL